MKTLSAKAKSPVFWLVLYMGLTIAAVASLVDFNNLQHPQIASEAPSF